MTAIREVRIVSMEGHDGSGTPPDRPAPRAARVRTAPLMGAILRARRKLFDHQLASGAWSGAWSGGVAPESDLLLLFVRLGMARCELVRHVSRSLVAKQLCDGGWSRYPGGGPDVSDSVRAYLALKLVGYPIGDERLERARNVIRKMGGADRSDAVTRLLLALFGQVPIQCAPRPPLGWLWGPWYAGATSVGSPDGEQALLSCALHLADPARRQTGLPDHEVRELFVSEPQRWPQVDCAWQRRHRGRWWDVAQPAAERVAAGLWRASALAARTRRAWRHFLGQAPAGGQRSDRCLSSIAWRALALRELGAPADSPELQCAIRQIEELVVRSKSRCCVQPRRTPLRDTAMAVGCLLQSGAGRRIQPLRKSIAWLIDQMGDVSNELTLPDAAWAVGTLRRTAMPEDEGQRGSLPPEIAVFCDRPDAAPEQSGGEILQTATAVALTDRWIAEIESRQNADGGWSAEPVPARGSARRDGFWSRGPAGGSWPDITGMVLRNLVGPGGPRWGQRRERAVGYLRASQRADGSWDGRIGVQALWATCQCTAGLFAAGLPATDETLRRAIQWILANQQPCGGWGELPAAADDAPARGQGPPGATQTGWCVEALTAVGLKSHPSVVRGVRYLLDEQAADGTWQDQTFSSVIIPRSVYGQNQMDATCSTLAALSRWAAAIGSLLEEAEAARQCLADAAVP